MFWINYSTRIKSTLRNREMIIWTWIFPIALSTLFFFAFSNLDSAGQFTSVKTAVVNDAAYQQNEAFRQTVDSLSKEEDAILAPVFVGSVVEGDQLLDKGDVAGVIRMEAGKPSLTVKEDGLNQTILKSFLDDYLRVSASLGHILQENPSALQNGLMEQIQSQASYTKTVSLTQSQPSESVNFFYALLAMVCLYGGFQGLRSVTFLQANLSPLGVRRCVAPAAKFRMMISDLLGGFTIHFGCLLIVVAYIAGVLGIDFGPKFGPVILTCLVGSLFGTMFGALISTISHLKEAAKTAILISVTMVLCFLSGLMVNNINYIVAQKAPLVAWLNPAARITDAFYCLYYYDTYTRFFLDIGILVAMSVVLFIGTVLVLRRQQYESV